MPSLVAHDDGLSFSGNCCVPIDVPWTKSASFAELEMTPRHIFCLSQERCSNRPRTIGSRPGHLLYSKGQKIIVAMTG